MTELELATESVKLLMPLYIDSAKTYSQLSIGALALTIVFKEKVLGDVGRMQVNKLLIASWFCFLISIAASAYYQWVAVRLINHYIKKTAGFDVVQFPLTISWLWPGYAYGLMVSTFFIAASLLVLSSIYQLTMTRNV